MVGQGVDVIKLEHPVLKFGIYSANKSSYDLCDASFYASLIYVSLGTPVCTDDTYA